MLTTVLYFVLLVIIFRVIVFLLEGANYVPLHMSKVAKLLTLAQVRPDDKVLDLGSGDGRIVIAMAQAGAQAYGYEINPLLVWWSRRKIKKLGLTDRAFIYRKNFWKENFNQFSVVTIFGIDYIMGRLEKKLKAELKPGSRILSFAFPLPDLTPTKREQGVYVYEI